MKLHPEDPRLTAWLLGELSAEEAAAVERAVAADPALQLAAKEIGNTQQLLIDSLSHAAPSLLPRQRDLILQAAREAERQSSQATEAPVAARKPVPWLFPLAAAAVLAFAAITLLNLPSTEPRTTGNDTKKPAADDRLPMEVALLPAPAPADSANRSNNPRPAASNGLANASEARTRAMQENGDLFLRKVAERLADAPLPPAGTLPPLARRSSANPIEQPDLALPVHAGRASLGWITRSIRGEKKLPPSDSVRLEEILNHFPLRPAGAATVARGVTLSSETIACPWKPSSVLLLVSFRGAADSARDVAATFKANPASVRAYRLLGFAPVAGVPSGPLPSRLPPKTITSLVIEIEPAAPQGNLAAIEWSVAGQAAPTLSLSRSADAEPSDDARFAALVCTYAQWLTGESPELIDADLLTALARECASANLAAERTDFLSLVDQSLKL